MPEGNPSRGFVSTTTDIRVATGKDFGGPIIFAFRAQFVRLVSPLVSFFLLICFTLKEGLWEFLLILDIFRFFTQEILYCRISVFPKVQNHFFGFLCWGKNVKYGSQYTPKPPQK